MALPAPAARLSGERWRLAAVTALAVLVAMSACGVLGRQAEPGTAGVAAMAVRPQRGSETVRSLSLVDGGSVRQLGVAEPVELAADLLGRFRLVSEGGGRHDLRVELTTASGVPVTGARLRAGIEMRFMEHGRAEGIGIALDPGSYLVPFAFEMPGEWRITLVVESPPRVATVAFDVDEFR